MLNGGITMTKEHWCTYLWSLLNKYGVPEETIEVIAKAIMVNQKLEDDGK